MLPVSPEVHHVSPIQFSERQPPYLPNVSVLPEAQPLLVHAASMLANEAGFLSTQTNGRMFTYNMLSDHNWQNEFYAEAVKLACDCAVLKYRTGQANTPASALNDAVSEVLHLLVSNMIVSFPELADFLSGEQLAGAAANNNIYQDLLYNIEDMYQQEISVGRGRVGQPIAGHVNGRGTIPRGVAGRGVAVGRGTPPPPPRGQGNVQHRQPAPRGATASGLYLGRNAQQQRNEQPLSRYAAAAKAREKAAAPVEQQVKKPDAPPPQPNVLTGEIENMNREMHSIAYFGQVFSVPTSPLRRAMEECTERHEEMANIDGQEIEMTERVFAEASMDELLAIVRASHAVNEKDVSVCLNQGLLVIPIIASVDISQLFSELANGRSFAQVARILSDHITGIKDKKLLRAATSYVSQIDRVLTKLANEFLMNSWLKEITIGSFIEDAPGLSDYLNTRFSGAHNKDYVSYQTAVLDHLFQHTRAVGDAVAQVTDYSDNAFWDNMVISYTVTYIDATAKELGYNVKKVPHEIRSTTTPLMARLVESTQKTYGRVIKVSQHIVVTSDDTRYQLYKRLGETDNFFTIKEI